MTSEIVNQLRKNSECLAPSIMFDAADAIERFIAERDEARRKLCCEWAAHGPHSATPQGYAIQYGWDCWKEDGK
jgi:hypothetical protein